MTTKAVILLAEGFEEIEALTPADVLRRADFEVELMSIGKKEVTGAHKITVVADSLFSIDKALTADLLILPGGMPGASNLDKFSPIDNLIENYINSNKHIAAICAAPMIIGKRGYLKGKDAVCYPGYENDLKGANIKKDAVVIDGKIITAQGVGAAMEFSLKLVEMFNTKEKAEELASKMVFFK